MMRNKRFYLILLGIICLNSSWTGKVEKAFLALERYDLHEAKSLFYKIKKKNAFASSMGLSLLYGKNHHPYYNLDSSYLYIIEAENHFQLLDDKSKVKMKVLGIDSALISDWKDSLDIKFYEDILKAPSVIAFQQYINRNSDSKLISQAVQNRDSMAFAETEQINTSDSYQLFINTYPEAQQRVIAKKKYDLVLYQEQTKGNTVLEFKNFVKNYPESPYNERAQDSVFSRSILKKDIASYYRFIELNPGNINVPKAWRTIYQLYMVEYSPERIIEFRLDYPNYPYVEELMVDIKLVNKLFLPFEDRNLWGFMSDSGEVLISAQYDHVEPFVEGLALVVKNGLVGFINKNNRIIIDLKYQDAENFQSGFAVILKDDLFGLINKSGAIIQPIIYEEIGPFKDGMAVIADDEHYGYLNAKGKIQVPMCYELAYDFSFKRAVVKDSTLYGLIDIHGDLVLDFDYNWLEPFNDLGLARIRKDSLFGIINSDLLFVAPMEYNKIGEFKNGIAMVIKGNRYGYIDETGKIVIPIKLEYFADALVWGQFENGFAKFLSNEKFGIIDRTGKKVVPAIFQAIGDFNDSNFFAVKKRDKWGFTDKSLKLKIDYQFEMAYTFNGNYAIVKKDSQWGIINKEGKVVLPFEAEEIKYQAEVGYLVKRLGKYGMYTKELKEIIGAKANLIDLYNGDWWTLKYENEVNYYHAKQQRIVRKSSTF